MSQYGGFSSVEFKKPKRAIFDHSHEKKISTRFGRLVPIFVKETLPNDTFKTSFQVLCRFAPLLAPLFARMDIKVYSFFVATRLLYKDYEPFFGNGRLGTETPPIPPRVSIPTVLGRNQGFLDKGSLADMMRFQPIPDGAAGNWTGITCSVLPWAACYKAWYDWFRDRNFVDDNQILPLASGTLAVTSSIDALFQQRYIGWEKDYFTSALTSTQRGTEVMMPLSGTGDVTYMDQSRVYSDTGVPTPVGDELGTAPGIAGFLGSGPSYSDPARIENIDEVNIDNSNVSILDFRTALALQSWYERQNVAGSKYNETVYAHFGRKTSDGRLQMADYLGGGKMMVRTNEVTTTAFSDDGGGNNIPAGNPTGHSVTMGGLGAFTYNCEEHGFVVSYLAIMPKPGYVNGTDRMFFERNTFLDYPWPTFANLGEQPVYDYELYDDPAGHVTDKPVFGYQSRYADWKYTPSSSHGDFRDTLKYWHLDRDDASFPTLSDPFVTMTPEESESLQDRIFAVGGDVDPLWLYIYIKCFIKRSLPYFGTPHLVG